MFGADDTVMSTEIDLILVVAESAELARDIKDLLEFMEAEQVAVAAPGDWRSETGDRRLAAVFVGPDIPGDQSARLLAEIGDFDPAVSIVMVDPRSQVAA